MAARTQDGAPKRAGVLRMAFRFAFGMHLDGQARTDATFISPGTQPVVTGYFSRGQASKWAMLAGWQRACIRWALLALLIGFWRDRHATEWALALIGGPVLGLAGWRVYVLARTRQHRREVVTPLAEALAPSMEMSPFEATRALVVPRRHDRHDAQIVAPLPDGHQGQPAQHEAITRIIGQRLGGEWDARVQRRPLALVVKRRPDPPGMVTFAQVADMIRASSALRPLMGLGAGDAPAWLDFADSIAHLGVSVGTGGGKSSFLRYLIAQFAYHGVRSFDVIDSKLVSLAGMEEVPGLRIHRETPGQWDALRGLREDMDSRYQQLLADPSATFPVSVILLEEQNDFAIEARAYWREIKGAKDPMTPPVYTDVTRLMIKGRQVGYRLIGVYQRLTAAACGGLDATVMRDAYGMKALSRFSVQAWDSLTGIKPRAESSAIPGRWTVVLGGQVRQVQVPYAEAPELLAFIGSSPLAGQEPWGVPLPQVKGRDSAPSQDAPASPEAPPAPPEAAPAAPVRQLHAAPRYLTQAEVAERLGMNLPALIKWRQRCAKSGNPLPEPVYFSGRPGWTADQLAELAARRSPESGAS